MSSSTESVLKIETLIESGTQISLLEQLLAAVESPATRAKGLSILHGLATRLGQMPPSSERLCIKSLDVPGSNIPIRLLVHPAVFTPEDWGRTFAEGLLKEPGIFQGKSVVELGTGTGWIPLLLLIRTGAASVMGLDINPIAVLCAKINVWLNGTDVDGKLLNSQFGVPIVEAASIAESDLLSQPLNQNRSFDFVVGCIPQVLHPELAEPSVSQASTEDLYDLSNYCFKQGILEDRFGLPLIARALEEAQLCLAPGGKVIFIFGGRPGPDPIDGVFRRRGFEPELLWSRRIPQADDTDLASLVALEKAHSIRFHFFVSRNSEQAISADAAVRLLATGNPIYHDLLVYRAVTRFEKPTFAFVKNLRQMNLDGLRRELDFSRMTEERMSYLSSLSADMMKSKAIPYPHERGDISLRRKLADFLNIYCQYSVEPEQLFVSAERSQLASMILNLVTARNSRVLLSRSLEFEYREVIDWQGHETIECNDDLPEIFFLDDLLKPDLVLLAPTQLANPSSMALEAVIAQAEKHPERWYIVDDSENFDISSDLNSNRLIRLAGARQLPPNVVLLYGLVKNVVQPDLQLSFLLNAPANWLRTLDIGAELTYSRIAYPSQHYYEWLFDDLLAFTFKRELTGSSHSTSPGVGQLPALTQMLDKDPVFAEKPISTETPGLIRLDYGEFEAPVPDQLVKGLFKGFLEESGPSLAPLVRKRVCEYLRKTRSADVSPTQIVLSQGVFPVLGALISSLAHRLGRPPRVAVPAGSYGPIYPLVQYHGGEVIELASGQNPLLTSADSIPTNPVPDLLWLTQPGNPSGLFMDAKTVESLLKKCSELGIYLLVDEIFFLLSDVRMGAQTSAALSFASHFGSAESKRLFVTDGLAKSFAAGGIRCGFLACPDSDWADEIQGRVWTPPRSTLRAWDSLYTAFSDELDVASDLAEADRDAVYSYITSARQLLSSQRDALTALLQEFDLDDGVETNDRGGLFVLAKLDEKAEALSKDAQLLVNPGDWMRLPGYARLCIGFPQEKFDRALDRLSKFLRKQK